MQIAAQRVGGMKVDETHSAVGDAPASMPHPHETRVKQHKKAPGKRNRRTRGLAPTRPPGRASSPRRAGRGKTPVKRNNGHAGVNGHDRASSPSAALHAPAEKGSAASVDASGTSAASAAVSAAAGLPRQASTDRDACAEVARAPSGRERSRQTEAEPRPRVPGDANARVAARDNSVSSGAPEKLPPGPGEAPLPDDIADFVDEIHSRVDLFEVLRDLLISDDEKVQQRALEKVLEMKYGKGAASSEEPVQVVLDVPRPIRD